MNETMHPQPDGRAHERWRVVVFGALIALAVGAVYRPSLSAPFVFDDERAILNNASIKQLWPLSGALTPPADGSGVAGRPLVNLSLAVNYALGGFEVRGYHVTNVALHVLAAWALFGLMRRTLAQSRAEAAWRNAAAPLAGCVALLWAVHPLQTESVTCVVQRTEVLVGLFYLATLYCLVRGAEGEKPALWGGAAVVAAACGMVSKEVMVTAPLVALGYDRVLLAGSWREVWMRRRWLHAGLMMTWGLLGALVWTMHGTRGVAAGFGLGVTWWSYALKQSEAIVHYLRLCAWPHPLVLDYGRGVVTDPLAVAPQIGLLAVLFTMIAMAWKRWPVAGFLGAAFFLVIAPSSSVLPLVAQTMAEHRMYLPLAVVVALATLGGFAVGRRLSFVVPVCLLLAVAYGFASFQRNALFCDPLELWRDNVAQKPDNPRVQSQFGVCLVKHGQNEEALRHFAMAVKLNPDWSAYRLNYATSLVIVGRFEEARAEAGVILAKQPKNAAALNLLGSALLRLGKANDAVGPLSEAVKILPGFDDAEINLADALRALGRFAEAALHAEAAVQLQPESAQAHYMLGLALLDEGKPHESVKRFEQALRLKPDDDQILNGLAIAWFRAENFTAAEQAARAAVRIAPKSSAPHRTLASALAKLGRWDEAKAELRYSQRLQQGTAP